MMNDLKCKECGAPLTEGMTECPSCGCPVQPESFAPQELSAPQEQPKASAAAKKMKFNITSIIALLLGIIIIGIGVSVTSKSLTLADYSAKTYQVDSARFGADFYTDIYEASDVMVDELSAINGGIEAVSVSVNTAAREIHSAIGILIISLGLGVVAVSCIHIKDSHPND